MFSKIKKNYFLLISTFLILYFFFNLLDGERGLFSYFKKKEILITLQNKEKKLTSQIKNLEFKNRVSISKKVIDLGSKDGNYEYHNLVSKALDTHITFTDLYPKRSEVLEIDFDKRFPLDENIFDFALF